MKKLSKLVSLMLSVVLCIGMAAPAFAIEYQVDVGRVYIENDESGKAVSWQENHATHNSKYNASTDEEIIIKGSYTETEKFPNGPNGSGSRITVGENVTDTTITLKNAEIDTSKTGGVNYSDQRLHIGEAALSVGKDSNVTIELEGENTLKSGYGHAGLELLDGASVTIRDAVKSDEGPASLTAKGGLYAAGIGGTGGHFAGISNERKSGNITITDGASVTATGGKDGAGIGTGGYSAGSGTAGGSVGNITITGGAVVTATGGEYGAGIGAGAQAQAGDITITGGASVTATGGNQGAGIGSARGQAKASQVGNITIEGGSEVTAGGGGGASAAGIGSGYSANAASSAKDITIAGNAKVTAIGVGYSGAGIGSGSAQNPGNSYVGNIIIKGNAEVTATSRNGAGIGSGGSGNAGNISITDHATVEAKSEGGAGIGTGNYKSLVQNIMIAGNASLNVTGATDFGATEDAKYSYYTPVGDIEVRHINDDNTLLYVYHPEGGDRIEYIVTPPDGEHVTVEDDEYYTVNIPAGSTATDREGNVTHLPHGGTIGENRTPVDSEKHVAGVAVEEPGSRVEPQIGVDGYYYEVTHCTLCNALLERVRKTIPALTEEPTDPTDPSDPIDPGTTIPDADVPLAGDPGADTATIEEQEVPLAGLTPLYMLLEELRQYEEIPEIELPEDFKWIDHAYAQAIYWGLQEELVVDTEEEPLDPDEALTVGLMREVLVNFVERYLGLDNFVVTLAGEDDELVMDLGERLTAFYTELETALAKQEKAA